MVYDELRRLATVHESLERQAAVDAESAPVVELRDFGGLTARAETVPPRYTNSTIFLNPTIEPDSLVLTLKYNRNLLDEGTVRGWLEAYRNLLLDAAAVSGVVIDYHLHPGYDHSYFFIASFMEQHVAFHAKYLESS